MMSNWTATSELRYLEKGVPAPDLGPNMGRIVPVLQQLYRRITDHGEGKERVTDFEWRDVPTVKE